MAAQMWEVGEDGFSYEIFNTYAEWCHHEWARVQSVKAELAEQRAVLAEVN